MLHESAKSKKGKDTFFFSIVKVCFLSLSKFFDFWKMQMLKNQICCGKGKNENLVDLLERENIKMQMAEEGRKIRYEITTGLFSW
jgi:hypothetical protein